VFAARERLLRLNVDQKERATLGGANILPSRAAPWIMILSATLVNATGTK